MHPEYPLDGCKWCGKPLAEHHPKGDVTDPFPNGVSRVPCGLLKAGFAPRFSESVVRRSSGGQQSLFSPVAPWAIFSSDERYRYLLAWPTGADNDRVALGIFANPSTATPEEPDPTVTRWIDYCQRWGFGWAWVANVRAWRETDPLKVPRDPLAIGPENVDHLRAAISVAELVVCGWGNLGGPGTIGRDTARFIRRLGKTPHALRFNADGSPTHPLYLPASLRPVPMEAL